MIGQKYWLHLAVLAIAVLPLISCGKSGPPLPPLVKLPVPPADLVAARRGDTVELSFSVPSVNTDGTRPANVSSTEVYAMTAPVTVPPISDANLIKFGTKVASVQVKAPKDPNLTADEDDPSDEVDAPEGPGLDQGAVAHLAEPLSPTMLAPADVPRDKRAPTPRVDARADGPLLGPPTTVPVRTYAAFGLSTRGRKGPLSKRIIVPLVPPPPPPSGAAMTYDETHVTLTWPAVADAPAGGADLLPSRAIGVPPRPAITYNVYDTTQPNAAVRLTAKPLDEPKYSDDRIVWGEKRCYIIVAAETIGGTTIESVMPPPKCETLVDTFPPAAPKGINAIASTGTINLIWEPSTEKDLAGYIVLRGPDPGETLTAITPEPIVEPSFKDAVPAGVAYAYVVKAVDKAGNVSPASARVVETAR